MDKERFIDTIDAVEDFQPKLEELIMEQPTVVAFFNNNDDSHIMKEAFMRGYDLWHEGVSFMMVDAATHEELLMTCGISKVPTVRLIYEKKIFKNVKGDKPEKLEKYLGKMADEAGLSEASSDSESEHEAPDGNDLEAEGYEHH